VLAHVFLRRGAEDPLRGFTWPAPGKWVESEAGQHAEVVGGLRREDLPYWLDDELWEVELAGLIVTSGHRLLAERARLRRRVEAWTDAVAWDLVAVCAHRVRDRAIEALQSAGRRTEATTLEACADLPALEAAANGVAALGGDDVSRLAGFTADVAYYARDAGRPARAAGVAAYIAAHALAGGERTAPGYDQRFDAERQWQADWLVTRLAL
jgi:hypothetical protein